MLVIEGGLDPTYVLDEMLMYELQPIINSIYLKNKESWELTRFISYVIAQVNSTKKIKMKDFLNFPWDEEAADEQTSISDDDIERLREKAKQYINNNK